MADESISSEMPNPEETSPMVDSEAPVDQGSEKPQEAFSAPVDPAERAAEDTILKAKTIKETKTLGPVRVFGEGGVISEQGAGRVQVFDFGASSFLTQRELRQMRQLLKVSWMIWQHV
jgi:hypothetical protein